MKKFIGLDLGSSAIKAVLMLEDGTIVDYRNQEVPFIAHKDKDVFVIDTENYFELIFGIIREFVNQAGMIDSLSWVTAGGSLILLDQKQNQLTQIISWMDRRSASLPSRMPSNYGITTRQYYNTVGWPYSPLFPFGKLMWIKEEFPEIFAAIDRICMTNDLLGMKLTNSWIIDNSTATTMNFFDQKNRQLCEPFVDSLQLKKNNFPLLAPVGTPYDELSRYGLEKTGLSKNTKIILGSFDHPGAARALDLYEMDQLMISCGTSWVLCRLLKDRETGINENYLMDPYLSTENGKWLGMASVSKVGIYFNRWVYAFFTVWNDSPPHVNAFFAIDKLALHCEISGNIPVIDIYKNIQIVDYIDELLQNHTFEEIARGILEGVVFLLKEKILSSNIDLNAINEVFLVGGAAESNIWPQIIADVIQKEVKAGFGKYTGAVGAAIIAASGIGVSVKFKKNKKSFIPNKKFVAAMDQRFQIFSKRH